LLSASFPSGPRGERYRPYDPGSISDSVVAVVRGVLHANGRLVFGGHPTITPLVLLVASELRAPGRVVVYQSRFFQHQVTPETRALEAMGFGSIRWVESSPQGATEDREKSLTRLRRLMVRETKPICAFFVGGMEGIEEEWRVVGRYSRRVPRIPIGHPGGASARLATQVRQPDYLAGQLRESEHYPVLVHDALLLAEHQREPEAREFSDRQ
jgi:hypothetical protein